MQSSEYNEDVTAASGFPDLHPLQADSDPANVGMQIRFSGSASFTGRFGASECWDANPMRVRIRIQTPPKQDFWPLSCQEIK
jgi:hypothetical protein